VLVNVRIDPNSGTKADIPRCRVRADINICQTRTFTTHRSIILSAWESARSSAQEMLNARWQYCRSAHLFLPDRRHRGREIPVVEAPTRNTKLIWT
jgi:hypothetical protein